jgi:hypothetical protein
VEIGDDPYDGYVRVSLSEDPWAGDVIGVGLGFMRSPSERSRDIFQSFGAGFYELSCWDNDYLEGAR